MKISDMTVTREVDNNNQTIHVLTIYSGTEIVARTPPHDRDMKITLNYNGLVFVSIPNHPIYLDFQSVVNYIK